MTNLLIETVLVAFCVGGVVGAVITMHLMHHGQREKAHDDKHLPGFQNMDAHVQTRRFHK